MRVLPDTLGRYSTAEERDVNPSDDAVAPKSASPPPSLYFNDELRQKSFLGIALTFFRHYMQESSKLWFQLETHVRRFVGKSARIANRAVMSESLEIGKATYRLGGIPIHRRRLYLPLLRLGCASWMRDAHLERRDHQMDVRYAFIENSYGQELGTP